MITVGGCNIEDIPLYEWRSLVNLITQDNQLFHTTILENLHYGGSCPEPTRIIHTTKLSCIYEHIMSLPCQFETILGDQGITLSGGERQRIAIARALIKNADIVLLDEATSAVDSDREKIILQNIYQHYTGKTIIISSHRLSSIKNVDEIICIHKGEVVEQGSHDELLKKKGYYWSLFKEQIE